MATTTTTAGDQKIDELNKFYGAFLDVQERALMMVRRRSPKGSPQCHVNDGACPGCHYAMGRARGIREAATASHNAFDSAHAAAVLAIMDATHEG